MHFSLYIWQLSPCLSVLMNFPSFTKREKPDRVWRVRRRSRVVTQDNQYLRSGSEKTDQEVRDRERIEFQGDIANSVAVNSGKIR